MAILFNILSALSIIGIIIAGLCGDAADGCCGCPGIDWMNDEACEMDRKIAAWVGTPSFIILILTLLLHKHFGLVLFGMFL